MPWKISPTAWLGVRPHYLTYEELSPGGVRKGLFMTCEWCWPRTTLTQRQQYLYNLVMARFRSGSAPMPMEEGLRIISLVRPLIADCAALPF